MEYRRTAVITLDMPEGADAHLRETVEQFEYCANIASNTEGGSGERGGPLLIQRKEACLLNAYEIQ